MCAKKISAYKRNQIVLQKIDTCILRALKTIQEQIVGGDAKVAIDFLKVSGALKQQYCIQGLQDNVDEKEESSQNVSDDSVGAFEMNDSFYRQVQGVLVGKKNGKRY